MISGIDQESVVPRLARARWLLIYFASGPVSWMRARRSRFPSIAGRRPAAASRPNIVPPPPLPSLGVPQMKSRLSLLAVGCLGLVHAAAAWGEAPANQGDWPQWRGPNRDGISLDQRLLKDWPADGPKVVWQVESVGVGYSSIARERRPDLHAGGPARRRAHHRARRERRPYAVGRATRLRSASSSTPGSGPS